VGQQSEPALEVDGYTEGSRANQAYSMLYSPRLCLRSEHCWAGAVLPTGTPCGNRCCCCMLLHSDAVAVVPVALHHQPHHSPEV
jgi:hypothetical protein